jgi:hypothetical protein
MREVDDDKVRLAAQRLIDGAAARAGIIGGNRDRKPGH